LNPEGLFEGRSGGSASGMLYDQSGELLRDCGTGELVQLTNEQDVIEMVLPGGAGYGDPRKRRRTAIETDLAEGNITPEKAKSDYGYSPAAMTAAE
jgi:5-oxoprolinase (ATP-hydrolysing)